MLCFRPARRSLQYVLRHISAISSCHAATLAEGLIQNLELEPEPEGKENKETKGTQKKESGKRAKEDIPQKDWFDQQ